MVRRLRINEDINIVHSEIDTEDRDYLIKNLNLICEKYSYKIEYFELSDKLIVLQAIPTKSASIADVQLIDIDIINTKELKNLDFIITFKKETMYGNKVLFDTANLIEELRLFLNGVLKQLNDM